MRGANTHTITMILPFSSNFSRPNDHNEYNRCPYQASKRLRARMLASTRLHVSSLPLSYVYSFSAKVTLGFSLALQLLIVDMSYTFILLKVLHLFVELRCKFFGLQQYYGCGGNSKKGPLFTMASNEVPIGHGGTILASLAMVVSSIFDHRLARPSPIIAALSFWRARFSWQPQTEHSVTQLSLQRNHVIRQTFALT